MHQDQFPSISESTIRMINFRFTPIYGWINHLQMHLDSIKDGREKKTPEN